MPLFKLATWPLGPQQTPPYIFRHILPLFHRPQAAGFTPDELRGFEAGDGALQARYARSMLKDHDELIRPYPYPLQALRFGEDLTLLALGGEVVVEFALWAKQQFGSQDLIVAAYSNDVMAYIPTAKMLGEGGHEPGKSMFVYGQPGLWDPAVEVTVQNAILGVMKAVGRVPARR